MVATLHKEFQRLNREVEALYYFLLGLTVLLLVRVGWLVYREDHDQLWSVLAQTTPLVAAILVARVANRLIVNSALVRADDERKDLVRVTHHLIAISRDLKAQVSYLTTMLRDGGRPILAIEQIADSIEKRYEALLEPDAYRFLPGPCVDLITAISGSIFGIRILAAGVVEATKPTPGAPLKALPAQGSSGAVTQLETLALDIQKLVDALFHLRGSVSNE